MNEPGTSEPARALSVLRLIQRDDLDDLRAVLGAAGRLLSAESAAELAVVDDYGSVSRALSVAWGAIRAALSGEGLVRDQVLGSVTLVDLLDRVRRLDAVLREAEGAHLHASLNALREAINRFRYVDSTRQLVEMAPEAICRLGFDRSILSRIENSMWVTHLAHIDGDAEWAAMVEKVGQENPQVLGPNIRETEMVRRKVPLLVVDVQHDEKVHRKVAEASLARSYVAAPLTVGDSVVGFLHCDRYFQAGDVDQFDRDMLATFAEGLSASLDRTTLLERLHRMQADVRAAIGGSATSLADPHAVFPPDASAGGRATLTDSPRRTPGPNALSARLTPRELEVLELIAKGETNSRIAAQLVLSEATVKSHTRKILRKLGAANRAEAVSKWFRASEEFRSA